MRSEISTIAVATAISVVASAASPAHSSPITLGAPFLFVENIGANDIGKTTGELIDFGDNTVIPNGSAGTTASAQTTNLSTGATVVTTLPFIGSTAIPNQFGRALFYTPNLVGPWTLNFTNGADTASVTTPSAVGATPPPYAKNVTVSGSSTNPTFSWSYPSGSVDGVIINIYDKSRERADGGVDAVYAVSLPGTTNKFTIPDALAGGLTLQLDHDYAIGIVGAVLRNPAGSITNSNIFANSRAFFDFRPVSAGSPVVNLPTITPAGAYQYSMTVAGGTTYFIDPAVAIGYQYAIGVGDPNFASVELPAVQSDPFDLSFVWNGITFNELLAADTWFTFPAGGVSAFTVTGIDPSDGLDPGNTTAFMTGITFVDDGSFTGTQTPITTLVAAPEPSSVVILGGGLFGLLVLRRRRIAVMR